MADDDATPTVEDVLARAMCDALVEAPLDEPCEGCKMQAAAVVAAVRAMSPEQQAQLIGGAVERSGRTHLGDEGLFVHDPVGRVVGPWRTEL